MSKEISFENMSEHDVKLIKHVAMQEHLNNGKDLTKAVIESVFDYINANGGTITLDPAKPVTWSKVSEHWHSKYVKQKNWW